MDTKKLQVSPRVLAEGSRSQKLRVEKVFEEVPQVITHASRGRDSFYFDLFSILGAVWLSFNALRGCLAIFSLRDYLAN